MGLASLMRSPVVLGQPRLVDHRSKLVATDNTAKILGGCEVPNCKQPAIFLFKTGVPTVVGYCQRHAEQLASRQHVDLA